MSTQTTALGYTILILLARCRAMGCEASGYDIAQWLKKPVSYFWHARHSQIYPELAKLEAGGMVTHRLVEQQERPDKKLYSITDEGLRTLLAWLVEPPDFPPARDEMSLKAYATHLMEPQQALELFREQKRRHQERLATYEAIREEMDGRTGGKLPPVHSADFSERITLQKGLFYERYYIEWCDWVIEAIIRLESRNGDLE